jgi:hypothetical protein
MMNYNDLLIEIDTIPFDKEGIQKNLTCLLRHAECLEGRTDIADSFAKGLLDCARPFIRKQIERLQLHIDDEADIIAWIARSLMELFFMLRYMYKSAERYDEVIKEQLKDLKQIEDIIIGLGGASHGQQEDTALFHRDMKRLWEAMSGYGIERDELKAPSPARYYAGGAGLMADYNRLWKIHSKYVHPSSYILFGRRNFVYADEVKKFFWVFAQYYAARNLRDLYKMIEATEVMGYRPPS